MRNIAPRLASQTVLPLLQKYIQEKNQGSVIQKMMVKMAAASLLGGAGDAGKDQQAHAQGTHDQAQPAGSRMAAAAARSRCQ